MKLSKRLRRRAQKERLGERWPRRKSHWLKLFPQEIQMVENFNKARPVIEAKTLKKPRAQEIGRLREEKVLEALQSLKKEGEIHDFLWPGKLSYTDLIEGVDFIFIYVDGCYKVCRFSVTGRKWVKQHKKRHPEVPVFSVDLKESKKSIEYKIISLKNGNNNHFHRR